jgi:hypothetical protein
MTRRSDHSSVRWSVAHREKGIANGKVTGDASVMMEIEAERLKELKKGTVAVVDSIVLVAVVVVLVIRLRKTVLGEGGTVSLAGKGRVKNDHVGTGIAGVVAVAEEVEMVPLSVSVMIVGEGMAVNQNKENQTIGVEVPRKRKAQSHDKNLKHFVLVSGNNYCMNVYVPSTNEN